MTPRLRASRARLLALATLLHAASAGAHDVGLDAFLNTTAPSANNPRTGALGLSLSGSVDVSTRWSIFLSGLFLRDFGTRTAEAASPGSNVGFASAGVTWLASDHLLFLALASGSPPTVQRSALEVTFPAGTADLVVAGTNASVGGTLLASYATAGLSTLEHALDVSVAINHYVTSQVAELPQTARATAVRTFCAKNAAVGPCPLVNGQRDSLTQVRLGATWVGTVALRTDVGLDVAGFLYDAPDPAAVGLFTVVQNGRTTDFGNGVPAAPWAVTARPSVTHRFKAFSVRAAYQLGVYTSGLGLNHLLSARLSWKATSWLRLSLSVMVQADVTQQQVVNRGATLGLGSLFVF
ncbi:MAG: hypothetical protein INH41_12660 [Myxococcaceae bacterium]|nr:hypothetical protein [Myxococcaceae bacterium]